MTKDSKSTRTLTPEEKKALKDLSRAFDRSKVLLKECSAQTKKAKESAEKLMKASKRFQANYQDFINSLLKQIAVIEKKAKENKDVRNT